MAAIDEKIGGLHFTVHSAKPVAELHRLFTDAAEVAQGGKITLTKASDSRIDGVIKNWIKVTHAVFTVSLTPSDDGTTKVSFVIGDYLRTRETLFYLIPVSPWSAPAYPQLKQFAEYAKQRV